MLVDRRGITAMEEGFRIKFNSGVKGLEEERPAVVEC